MIRVNAEFIDLIHCIEPTLNKTIPHQVLYTTVQRQLGIESTSMRPYPELSPNCIVNAKTSGKKPRRGTNNCTLTSYIRCNTL